MFESYPFRFKPIYILIPVVLIIGVVGLFFGQTLGYNKAKSELSKQSTLGAYSILIDGKVSGTSFDNAILLKIGYETQGTFKSGRNIDTYYFQLDTKADVRTYLSNVPHEYNTFVYNDSQKLIASTLRSGYKDSTATIGNLNSGKYYIQVVTKYDEPVDYPYTIRVDILPITE